MATASTTNPSDFANRTQTLFNPKLLESLKFNLKLAKYGLSEGYSTIGYTIRFFRPRKASLSGINAQAVTQSITPLTTPTAITEGTVPTNLTEVAVGYVDVPLTQRAGLAKITDKLQAIDLLNTVKTYSTTMGADAALDYDTVIRNSLINGVYNSDNTYNNTDGGYFERFVGITNTGVSATDWASLAGASKSAGKINRAESLRVITQLKASKVPTIGGKYVAVVPPQVIHDIRQDTTWTQTGTFQDKDALFKDMAIMLDGVAFVEANNPWMEDTTYGTEDQTDDDGSGLIYSTIYLGDQAFGIPNLNNTRAGGSQSAPKLIVLNQPDKNDPINQLTIVGWKSLFGSKAFITQLSDERPRYCVLRSKSTFV